MRFSIACGVGLASLLLGGLLAAPAAAASPDELEKIKQILKEQEETIRALRERVEELEREAEAPAPPPPQAAPEQEEETESAKGEAPSPVEEVEKKMYGEKSPIIWRDTLNDRQTPAARPGDYTLQPEYRGFIPIPRTAVMVKFNAKPRVDFIGDSGNPGTDFRFVPALFPPSDNSASSLFKSDGWQFSANGNASQLIVDVRAPSVEGTPRFYYQNDFFGSNSNPMNYRLQHLYGEYAGFVAGFTFGVFEDPDAWPNTVDYEGPNSVIFARRAVAQYMREIFPDWQLTLSLENPDIYVDTTGDPGADQRSRAPDGGFALEWTPGDLGHLRVSSIFRSIGVDGGAFGSEDAFGWGINASGNLHLTSRDNMQYWFVYGEGVGGMGNDTSFVNSDAAFNASGKLKALEYWSAMLALSHKWTPRWSSTGTYGYVYLENTALQDAIAYHRTQYASVNLMYQMFKRLRIGVEGLYGWKEVNDGTTNDIFRVQAGLAWALFD